MKLWRDSLVALSFAAAASACAGHSVAPAVPAVVSDAAAPHASATPTCPPNAGAQCIVVDTTAFGKVISGDVVGVETSGETQDNTQPWLKTTLAAANVRFATYGDNYYHWQANAFCTYGVDNSGEGIPPYPGVTNATLDAFEQNIAVPLHLDVEVHVPVGTDPTCTKRASPSEAQAWVQHENGAQHFGIKYWQLGLDPFATDNGDFGPLPLLLTDAGLYGTLVDEFRKAMKQADPTIKTGIGVQGFSTGWDPTAIQTSTLDFTITPVSPSVPSDGAPPSDQWELTQGVASMVTQMQFHTSQLAVLGKPNASVIFDDFIMDTNDNQRQVISIVGALFAGQVLAEAMQNGIAATAWPAFGGGACSEGFATPSNQYGWQNYSSDEIDSEGLPNQHCPDAPVVPAGTLFPTGRGLQLAAAFGHNGERMLGAVASTTSLRAYAATQGKGYALFLFNLDPQKTYSPKLVLSHSKRTQFTATTLTYDKALYDRSKNNVWAPPASSSLGKVGSPFSIALPPWSMTVVVLQ